MGQKTLQEKTFHQLQDNSQISPCTTAVDKIMRHHNYHFISDHFFTKLQIMILNRLWEVKGQYPEARSRVYFNQTWLQWLVKWQEQQTQFQRFWEQHRHACMFLQWGDHNSHWLHYSMHLSCIFNNMIMQLHLTLWNNKILIKL